MYTKEKEWAHKARLTTVIDCGTHGVVKKAYITFQLLDYDVVPQDPSLPVYKQFAKFPYGSIIEVGGDQPDLDFWIDSAGKCFLVDITTNEYQGKEYPIVSKIIEPIDDIDCQWWVDVKSFVLTPETTKDDVNALWFDNKWVKKSLEYKSIISNMSEWESIEELF